MGNRYTADFRAEIEITYDEEEHDSPPVIMVEQALNGLTFKDRTKVKVTIHLGP